MSHLPKVDPTLRESDKALPPPQQPPFFFPINVAFYIFSIANILAAIYAPILDCDETFNFWEPTHYLSHGYGFETWEYSPEYSIRSWLYVSLHALVGRVGSFLLGNTKTAEFYIIRIVLGLVCSACETRLYSSISRTLNPRIGALFVMIMVFTPGMFHASVAYLPSSFAMYTSMLGLNAFVDWHGGPKTAQGIVFFAIGAIIGWPFAGALILPFLIEEGIVAIVTGEMVKTIWRVLDGVMGSLVVLCIEVLVDTTFYNKLVIVPWKIVFYNVLSGGGDKGPDIFGTEPWTFYIRNLLLNFNIWFLLALSAGPLLLLQYAFRRDRTSPATIMRSITFVSPFYLWFTIFTLQPHKEERFMYPAYPFLALNAAIALHLLLSYLGSTDQKEFVGRIPPQIKLIIAAVPVMASLNLGVARTLGMVTGYNTPLSLYKPLAEANMTQPGDLVCLGKEWYRFPTSYLLPDGVQARFIKSEFDGLLPGQFAERETLSGTWAGTRAVPPGMNDRNEEDFGKYVDVSQCAYLVDSYFAGTEASQHQPHHVLDEARWEKVVCKPFLDASQTSFLGRMVWTPDLPLVPASVRRRWGTYCLLKSKSGGKSDV